MISEMAKTTATTLPSSPIASLVMFSWMFAAMLSHRSTWSSVVRVHVDVVLGEELLRLRDELGDALDVFRDGFRKVDDLGDGGGNHQDADDRQDRDERTVDDQDGQRPLHAADAHQRAHGVDDERPDEVSQEEDEDQVAEEVPDLPQGVDEKDDRAERDDDDSRPEPEIAL